MPEIDQDVLVLTIDLEEPPNKLLGIGSRPAQRRQTSERDPDAQQLISVQKHSSRVHGRGAFWGPGARALARDPIGSGLLRVARFDLPLMAAYFAWQGALYGHARFGILALSLMVHTLLKLVGDVLLAFVGLSVTGAILAQVAASIGVLGFLFSVVPPPRTLPAFEFARPMLMMALPLSLYALALQIHINPSLWLLSAAGNAGDARGFFVAALNVNRTLSVVQAVLSGLVPGGADRSCRRPLSGPRQQPWRRGRRYGPSDRRGDRNRTRSIGDVAAASDAGGAPHFAGGRLRDRVDDADFRADLGRRPMARSEARRSARSLADDARAAERAHPGKPEAFRHLASRRRVTVPMSRASPLSPACRHRPRAATAQGSDMCYS